MRNSPLTHRADVKTKAFADYLGSAPRTLYIEAVVRGSVTVRHM